MNPKHVVFSNTLRNDQITIQLWAKLEFSMAMNVMYIYCIQRILSAKCALLRFAFNSVMLIAGVIPTADLFIQSL